MSQTSRFINKVAVITGGAGGIGLALATQLHQQGCAVALVDISDEMLQQASEKLQIQNKEENSSLLISTHNCDVTQEINIQRLVAEIIEQHGRVDMLFNNAGMTVTRSFEEHDISHWKKMIDLNLWSVIYGCKYFLPELKKTQGSIINTSSLAGLLGLPYQSSYSLTKMAVKSLSESLYAELKVSGVHVLSVHPGAIKTSFLEKAVSDSDNPGLTEKIIQLTNSTAITPEKLATKIITGIVKRKQRVVVGIDANAIDILKRLMPSLLHKLFAGLFSKVYKNTNK